MIKIEAPTLDDLRELLGFGAAAFNQLQQEMTMKLDDLKAAADSLKADLADVATKLSVVVSNEAVQLAMIADLKARIAQGTITEADLDPLAASLAEDKSVIAQLRAALAPISTPLAPDTSTGGTNQPPPPDQGQV